MSDQKSCSAAIDSVSYTVEDGKLANQVNILISRNGSGKWVKKISG